MPPCLDQIKPGVRILFSWVGGGGGGGVGVGGWGGGGGGVGGWGGGVGGWGGGGGGQSTLMDLVLCLQNEEKSLPGTLRRKNIPVRTYMLGVNHQ